MKVLRSRRMADGRDIDHFAEGREAALKLQFEAMLPEFLQKRRGTGGTFRITLEWTPGGLDDFYPKPEKGP